MQSEELWQAVRQPGPLMSDRVSLAPEDAQLVSLLRALRYAGAEERTLHALCRIFRGGSQSAALPHLRAARGQLLARLHEQQRTLNELDHVIAFIRGE